MRRSGVVWVYRCRVRDVGWGGEGCCCDRLVVGIDTGVSHRAYVLDRLRGAVGAESEALSGGIHCIVLTTPSAKSDNNSAVPCSFA